ncbi:hypothetical protein WK32_08320 [Burkholderia vietnamiensis]|nr:hypothetical protein WK32_08320 [Burkholderia vietnamiensis]
MHMELIVYQRGEAQAEHMHDTQPSGTRIAADPAGSTNVCNFGVIIHRTMPNHMSTAGVRLLHTPTQFPITDNMKNNLMAFAYQ